MGPLGLQEKHQWEGCLWGLCGSECSGHLGLEGAGAGLGRLASRVGGCRGHSFPTGQRLWLPVSLVEVAFERVGPGPQPTPLLPSPWDRRVWRGPRNWESGQRGGLCPRHPVNQAPGPPSVSKASGWLPLPIQRGGP